MPKRFSPTAVDQLIQAITELRDRCVAMERSFASEVELVTPDYQPSARNLLHYLGLRAQDLRDLQRDLSSFGLSSLGRSEAHTLAGLDAILAALHKISRRKLDRRPEHIPPVDFTTGPALLATHTESLLGPLPAGRTVRIMVTMPTEASTRYVLVRDLVREGMDVMRINCAHDGEQAWLGMVENLRRAERELGRSCRILMDLGGPKLRTGKVEGGIRVTRWRPRRDSRGHPLEAARIWITAADAPCPPPLAADAVLPLAGRIAATGRRNDTIRLRDCRQRARQLRVVRREKGGLWAESLQGAYVEEGTLLRLYRDGRLLAQGAVQGLPEAEPALLLHAGDILQVTRDNLMGRGARRSASGRLLAPARIPCTLEEVFADVRAGERIFFDDGRIGGVIRKATADGLEVEITQAGPQGCRLRSDKGINLPDSRLSTPPLTAKDLKDLEFAARYADMVGYSFVSRPEDVLLLEKSLDERGGSHLGILLKIETRAAFEQLPRLLLVGLQSPPLGVMVARGDLGVEMGFERLAEVQEEILWLCEAAHVPVIWATQVLETMARKGMPSRAEVTDAAMSGRAECVMLNKGPHILSAVRFLDDILKRMQMHQHKKRTMLRKLSVSRIMPDRVN